MKAIGRGLISAVMSYTMIGWGSSEGTFIIHVYDTMILLSVRPVISKLPLPYPDLVFTREWEGWFLTGTVGDFDHIGNSGSEGDFGLVSDFDYVGDSLSVGTLVDDYWWNV